MLRTGIVHGTLRLAGLLLGFFLAGCGPQPPDSTPTATASQAAATLLPYSSPTATRLAPAAAATNNPQVSLQPTATPFVHEVVADDTLLGIALFYGVQVEDILAANPGIDPRLLSIGMTITIPLSEDGAAVLPTAEPLPVELGEPVCYRTATQDAWCFVLARNSLEDAVESLTAQLALLDQAGEVIATQQAAPPLNLIPAGEAMPVYGFFSGPLPELLQPRVELVSAFPAADTSARYVTLVGDAAEITLAEDGQSALVAGELQVAAESPPASRVRLAAIGYTASGQVAGVRVWEQTGPLAPGETLAYSFRLFSLGPELESVEVFYEGRP